MDDLISRAELFDELNCRGVPYNAEVNMVINRMPSARQRIPCSERLPEVGRSVLLSIGGMYAAEGCLREDGDWTQFRWSAIQRKDMVGAWMPLPKPYKGEQE